MLGGEQSGHIEAIGFELYQGWSYAIDLSARAAASGYDDGTNVVTAAVQVGFNWY